MKQHTRSIVGILILSLIFNLMPIKNVQASENDMNIISKTTVTSEDAKKWAQSKGATQTFIGLADVYWKYYESNGGINPVVAYVQSAIETGYGKFGGVLDETYFNPCGMKVNGGGDDTDATAHQRFNNWDEGVQAHLDHLALYAGAEGYPRSITYDPRHFGWLHNTVQTVQGLSGKWASDKEYGDKIMRLYNEVVQIARKPERTAIDSPKMNESVSGSTLTVSGWALNDSGIKEVRVYVDNTYKGNAEIGLSRPDVDSVYPGYMDGYKSGYKKEIDLRDVPAGYRTIKVEQVGNDGSTNSVYINVNVQRKPLKIEIDSPRMNETINGSTLNIKGWALNDSGIKEVKVYVDGKYISNATTGILRPDVDSVFPGYVDGNKGGYETNLNLQQVSPGNRKIRVEQIGNDGSSTYAEVNVKVEKKASRIEIDSPRMNETITGSTLNVKGWALNDSGVKEIKVYVDGNYINNATTGILRPDVNNAFPGYVDGDKSGYEVKLNLGQISPGNRKIKVEQIGNDGSSTYAEVTVKVEKKVARIEIDSPRMNDTINGTTLNVKGWALNDSGVKEVKVYVDGKYISNATTGILRPDVNNAFPGYVDGDKSGYEVKLNLGQISPGNRKIKVEQIGNDGSSTYAEVNVKVEKKPLRIEIDSPRIGETISENVVKVNGWALNESGVKEIKVYVDGKYVKNANIGILRPDVNSAFPGYAGGDKSGYEVELDVKDLSSGKRMIRVEQIGNDGSSTYADVSINLEKKISRMAIDSPKNNSTINEKTLSISGWALNASGVKEIKVYIDDKFLGNANTGITRTDVNSIYPGYINGDKSGYEMKVDLTTISPGNKKIVIQQVGNDGSVQQIETYINVAKKAAKIEIDTPRLGDVIDSDKLTVSGWALNDSGVKEVKVYLDGVFKAQARIGISRPDVNSLFPGYTDGYKAGYEAILDISNVSDGMKSIKVEQIGYDGTTKINEILIKIQRKKLIVVDPGHNYGGNRGASATHNGKLYREEELTLEIGLKLEAELKNLGYDVYMTRGAFDRPTESLDDNISKIVNVANSLNADALISLHLDSSASSAKGVSTFYSSYKPGLDNVDIVPGVDPNGYTWYDFEMDLTPTAQAIKGRELAKVIVDDLAINASYSNRKEHDRGLGVTRRANIPSVLVECGFISNIEEAQKASSSTGQQKIANSIANSIKKLF